MKLMDRDGAAEWQLADPEKLRAERERSAREAADKAAEKVANKLATKCADLDKELNAAIPPAQLFQQPKFAGQYSEFDEKGKPAKDASGEPLSKAAGKNVSYPEQIAPHPRTRSHPAYHIRMHVPTPPPPPSPSLSSS